MGWKTTTACLAAGCLAGMIGLGAQQAPAGNPGAAPDAQGGDGASLGLASFAAFDQNVDNAVTRAEMETAMAKWVADAGTAAEADLAASIKFPQPRLPFDSHMQAMLAALPAQAAAKPQKARKVLVLNKTAGFIH